MKKIFLESKATWTMMNKVRILRTPQDNTAAKQYTKKARTKYSAIQKQLLNYLINKILPALLNINKAIRGYLKFYNLGVSSAQILINNKTLRKHIHLSVKWMKTVNTRVLHIKTVIKYHSCNNLIKIILFKKWILQEVEHLI